MTTRRHLLRPVSLIAAAVPAAAIAAPPIALESAVFVERIAPGARLLERARQLKRGDRLVYIVSWQRSGDAGSDEGGFTVTNPLPQTVAYQRSERSGEEVSVDGGKTWGKLVALRIGARQATPEDVTHVRWRVAPAEAARRSGRITYSAIVR